MTSDPNLATEMYRSLDDIGALAESVGMSERGGCILYVRFLRRIVGPTERMSAELLDRAMDYLPQTVQAELAGALRTEIRVDRKFYDIVHRLIFRRAAHGTPLPDWLAEIAADMDSGKLARPKPPGRGRPRGVSRIRHPDAQRAMARLAYILDEVLCAQGHQVALENESHPSESIYGMVAEALSEDGICVEWYSVRHAYQEHAKSLP